MGALAELAASVQGSALSTALRASRWTYPLVNAGHLLGLALLIGAIVPLDLRLLGLWPDTDARALERACRPVAVAGLAIALGAGALLFAARPLDYVASGLFGLKLALIAAALANAAAARSRRAALPAFGPVPAPLRRAALLSLLLWPSVLLAGRLIGYR